MKRTPDQAVAETMADFSKWYFREYAKRKDYLLEFDPIVVERLEKDYVRCRQVLLDLIWKANPQLTVVQCQELLPDQMMAPSLVWAKK